MGFLNVLGGLQPPSYPVNGDLGFNYQEYYNFGGPVNNPPLAPSNLSALTASSSQINLSWTDNATDEDGFDIERSTDGTNFVRAASLTSNANSYSDTGLQPTTTYYYRTRAFNANGNSSYSNTASSTTSTDTMATLVQVGSITVSTVNVGQGSKIGRAEVVVIDDQGGAVANAVVSGEFTGSYNELITASSPTDANGVTIIDTSSTAKGGISFSFCVTGITHNTLLDFTAPSGAFCSTL